MLAARSARGCSQATAAAEADIPVVFRVVARSASGWIRVGIALNSVLPMLFQTASFAQGQCYEIINESVREMLREQSS